MGFAFRSVSGQLVLDFYLCFPFDGKITHCQSHAFARKYFEMPISQTILRQTFTCWLDNCHAVAFTWSETLYERFLIVICHTHFTAVKCAFVRSAFASISVHTSICDCFMQWHQLRRAFYAFHWRDQSRWISLLCLWLHSNDWMLWTSINSQAKIKSAAKVDNWQRWSDFIELLMVRIARDNIRCFWLGTGTFDFLLLSFVFTIRLCKIAFKVLVVLLSLICCWWKALLTFV